MLASIIANLQNLPAEAQLPTVKIDRGGGGASWPGYEIVDILAAVQSFPEVAGEDSVARAVRRSRWIGEVLPRIREAREKREAAAFLAGAAVADAAAQERHVEGEAAAEQRRKLIDQLKIEQIVEIVDAVRGTQPARRGRGVGGPTPFALAVGIGIGVAIGVGISRSSRKRRRAG